MFGLVSMMAMKHFVTKFPINRPFVDIMSGAPDRCVLHSVLK